VESPVSQESEGSNGRGVASTFKRERGRKKGKIVRKISLYLDPAVVDQLQVYCFNNGRREMSEVVEPLLRKFLG